MSNISARNAAVVGMYTAFCVVVGFLLAPIPNIELLTLSVFLGGYFFGMGFGCLIGAVAMFVFSAFNPWGSGLAFPPLLVSQVVSYGIIGFIGGVVRRLFLKRDVPAVVFGFIGGVLSSFYYLVVTISTASIVGFSLKQTGIAYLSSISFSLLGIGINIILFALFAPILIRTAWRYLSF